MTPYLLSKLGEVSGIDIWDYIEHVPQMDQLRIDRMQPLAAGGGLDLDLKAFVTLKQREKGRWLLSS